MNDPADSPIPAPLRDYLSSEAHGLLAAQGQLPPALVRAECARLRGELGAIATYIPAIVVREQLASPRAGLVSGTFWQGSVLFADLSGFTALSERLSALGKQGAEEISTIINSLFTALVEEIHRHCGELLKFGGDALTAFFDAATLGGQHAMLAGHAALAMQERMAAFDAITTRVGEFRLRLRVGVHSGRVFAAQVGDQEHIEVVVTGHDINRVALAQEIAAVGELVISDATQALLPGAQVDRRAEGFFLLRALPRVGALPAAPPLNWPPPSGDMGELLALAERIDALSPYLPCNLPQRFLEPAAGAEQGEFRPVTVLFANFYPFSAVLDRLEGDLVTATRVLNAYYCRAQQVIHRYRGIVNKVDMYTSGDKLMALFGAPVAHEDDPQRAVRAALDLHRALDEANAEIAALMAGVGKQPDAPSPVFQQRIGINTGVVFAGQVGSATRHEYTVMGRSVNLAARLMSSAGAGQAVISPATRRVAERVFVLRDLPAVMLKGIAEPVPLAEVLHPREAARELQSSLARPDIVGRETELARLMSEARVALRSGGRVFALVGEAGTGKSRLIEDALGRLIRLARDSALPLFFSYGVECQGYEQNTPYAAARELLRQVFSVVGDGPQQAEAVRRRVAMLAPDQARFTPLLGGLISLPLEETPLTAGLTPQQRHDRALDLVEELILAEARRQPLLLIVDDLHWADASSLELLARLARRVVEAPMLVVFGYRPDPHIPEPWRDLPHCVRLSVGELTPEGSEALVRALLRGEPPPELAGLIERAQGNPFFIEEVVRSLVDFGGLERTAQGWRLTRPPDQLDLPDSIEGLITARLDRLEQRCRDVIQAASVIGRRFGYHVLTGILTQRDDLSERLRLLVTDELILPEEIERDLAYLFKHALTRDVAYGAILYARRRELHRRVAHEIEHLYADRLDDQLAVLARHYLLAEEWSIAFDYHLWAGRYAQSRYANREAIELLERALWIRTEQGDSLQDLGPTPNAELIEINERLGVVHALIGEYDKALVRYEAALALMHAHPGTAVDELIRLHHHIARVYEKRAEFDTAFEWVERALALGGTNQSRELVRCLLLGAGLHRRQGRNAQALEMGEQARRLAEACNSQRELAHAFKLLGIIQLYLGDTPQALDLLRRSVQIYEQAHDLSGLADAHNDLAIACYEQGLLGEALQHYEAGIQIKETIGDVYGQAMIANNLGDVFRLQQHIDEAIKQYQRSLGIFERLNSIYATGVLHMNLGATYLLRNDLDLAERHLRRSVELAEQAGAEDFLAELERYLAELQLQRGDLAQARLAAETALGTALRLEARFEEGITRRTLGQILARLGETASAWQELEHSQSILRATASSHELARSLLAMAALAPSFDQYPQGQQMLDEAIQILSGIGAQRDLDEAHIVAAQHGYLLSN